MVDTRPRTAKPFGVVIDPDALPAVASWPGGDETSHFRCSVVGVGYQSVRSRQQFGAGMSLWTPEGEHPVPRDSGPSAPEPEAAAAPADDPLEGLSDEQREAAMAMAAEMEEVRRQLSSVPAAVVVANHAMGLYEL